MVKCYLFKGRTVIICYSCVFADELAKIHWSRKILGISSPCVRYQQEEKPDDRKEEATKSSIKAANKMYGKPVGC